MPSISWASRFRSVVVAYARHTRGRPETVGRRTAVPGAFSGGLGRPAALRSVPIPDANQASVPLLDAPSINLGHKMLAREFRPLVP